MHCSYRSVHHSFVEDERCPSAVHWKDYEGMDKMVERLEKVEPDSNKYKVLKDLCQDR